MEKEGNSGDDRNGHSVHEICHEESGISAGTENRKGFNAQNALIAVVFVLVVIAGVQVFQMQRLLDAVSSGAVKARAQTQGSSIGFQSQVGGCG